jgi:hypothetical protein
MSEYLQFECCATAPHLGDVEAVAVYQPPDNSGAPIVVTCGSFGGLAAYALNFEQDGTETEMSLQLLKQQKQWELGCERLTGLALSSSSDGVKAVTVSEVQSTMCLVL